MMHVLWIFAAFTVALLAALTLWGYLITRRQQRQHQFVRDYCFPTDLRTRVLANHPALADVDWPVLESGFRQFLLVWIDAQPKPVRLPSRALGWVWQAFRQDSDNYARFCASAFGRWQDPPDPDDCPADRRDPALVRTWEQACRQEGLSAYRAQVVPSLFLLDQRLGITELIGFRPVPAVVAQAPAARSEEPDQAGPDPSPESAGSLCDEAPVTSAEPSGDDHHECASDAVAADDGDTGDSDGDGGGDGGGDGD